MFLTQPLPRAAVTECGNPNSQPILLGANLQAELKITGATGPSRIGVVCGSNHTIVVRIRNGGSWRPTRPGFSILSVIEDIEYLCAKCNTHLFRHTKSFAQCRIDLPMTRSLHGIASKVSPSPVRRNRECRIIEPVLRSFVSRIQIRVRNQIRALILV